MRCLVFVIAVFTSSCAHFRNLPPTQTPGPEARDVPLDVRGDNESPRHRVLVLPFLEVRPGLISPDAEFARALVIRDLKLSRQIVVVTPEELSLDVKKYIDEKNDYNLGEVAKVAQQMGLAAVVEGKLLSIQIKRTVDSLGLIRAQHAETSGQLRLRAVAGRNGKEIFNDIRSAVIEASSSRLGSRLGSAAPRNDPELGRAVVAKIVFGFVPPLVRAIDKLNWEGRVAMVNGERVFLNAGRLSGVQIGDLLKVSEEGDDVYDPDSGRFIGTAPGRLKGTVEVRSYFGKDGAIAIIHSGSGFLENDRVELY